ncbi:uncharacterized protein LOC119178754 isoform X2 [Rhipicephalus microplus]|uniref:uncharacterized protein LOC119178754 isoform X2 n=1 Tax=Rhipicephalus microplus TaxID=6941 RepID=UPI00188814A6|nr:zinc finger protein 83-like isoform X2 [Rhipicephalus microplus]
MASKCLVEFRDKKIVVNFDGSLTRQQLFDNLQASGVIVNVDTARLRLRVYDKDFSTFVDVTDDFVIKDKFKVQLHEVSEYRHPVKMYEERAKALVRKFPNLADYIRTGYDSWREALRFKGKYERRQIWIHRGETVPTKKHRSDGTLTIYEPVLRKVTRPTTGAMSVDIKVEQSSPPNSPPPWLECVNIKEEPSSPPTTPPCEHADPNEGVTEAALGDSSTEASSDIIDSRISGSATGSSPMKPETTAGSWFECDICEQRYTSKGNLRRHQSVHKRKKEHSCLLCGKKFTLKSYLITHERVHTGEKLYTCHICGKKFPYQSALTIHKAVHTDEKPYSCSVCGRKFAYKCSLQAHKVIHMEENPHTCLICGKKFAQKSNLEVHKAVHMDEKPYSCSVCGRRFGFKHSLLAHELIHKDDNPYRCFICGQNFMQKSSLIKHERVHTAKMPYACKTCPSKFCKKASLSRHMQLHAAGVEMFHCTECGKTFERIKTLRNHLKWHKMDKPHLCHLCPSRFTQKRNLYYHVMMHKGEKPHTCPICKKLFSRTEHLKVHMRRMHSGVNTTLASTDSMVKIPLSSSPSTKVPSEHADANGEGVAEAACGGSSTEIWRDNMDSE